MRKIDKIIILIILNILLFSSISYANEYEENYKLLELTTEEIQYIESNRILKYAIATDYAPIEYLGKNKTPKGIGVEYLNYASRLLGIEFKPIEGYEKLHWEECLELLNNKEIDILPALSYTNERANYMRFSDVYFEEDTIVIGNKGNSVILTLNDLEGKKLVFPKAHWQNDFVKENLQNIEIVNVKGVENVIKYIDKNEGYYSFVDETVYMHYLKKHNYKNIEVVGELDIGAAHRMGISYDNEILVSILNKVIEKVAKVDVLRDSFYVDEKLETNVVLLFISISTFFILVIIILILSKKLYVANIYKKTLSENRVKLFEDLSHDLKTPLTVLKANIGLIEKGIIMEEEKGEYYSIVNENINNISDIIDELKKTTELKELIINKEVELMNLNHFLLNVFKIEKVIFEEKRVDFILEDNSYNNEIYVMMNKNSFYRAISNILSNALKHTDEKVILGFGKKENVAYIYISNSGDTIKSEDIENIFDRFYQGKNRKVGQGLGLAIAKEIVLFHGGDITVNSNNNLTTFTISIPITKNP